MFKFAWQNLLSRPLRTTLSVAGLTIAIAGMVGLFSIAGGINHLVSSTFELIPGLLVQQRGAPMPLFSALPADWAAELRDIPGVTAVNPEVLARVNRIEQKTILSPPRFLLGVEIDSRLGLEHGVYDEHVLPGGRFLTDTDRGTRNCVVSRQIAEQFDKQVGDAITVNGTKLTIVGLYHCGSLMLDVNILLDVDAVRELARIDRNTVCSFYIEHDGRISDSQLARQIEQQFTGRDARLWEPSLLQKMLLNALSPNADGEASNLDVSRSETALDSTAASDAESPVEVRTQQDWAERFDDFTADLNLFLSIMTTVGLLIAISSIVNTMLMSITERQVEFGILRANGWSRRHIMQLVTGESALLGLTGGFCGALLGWVAVQGINVWQADRMHLYAGPGLLSFSLLFSTLLGIAGGLYPAWRAASKSPMQAIRRM
ncbi:MAG: ABC transporter permease [Planctomycetaceae bacterium]